MFTLPCKPCSEPMKFEESSYFLFNDWLIKQPFPRQFEQAFPIYLVCLSDRHCGVVLLVLPATVPQNTVEAQSKCRTDGSICRALQSFKKFLRRHYTLEPRASSCNPLTLVSYDGEGYACNNGNQNGQSGTKVVAMGS